MPKSKPLTDAKGEVRELSAKDMTRFRPARDALPPPILSKLEVRGPQRHPGVVLSQTAQQPAPRG